MSESAPTTADTRRLAEEARDRVRFEEEALELSDQVYRVARGSSAPARRRRISCSRRTSARSARWRQFTPGTNLRAWLLRILTNLNIDRGRRAAAHAADDLARPEAGDYFLYNQLEAQVPDDNPDEERVLERLSPGLDRRRARRRAARFPRRARARRHRRVHLRRRGADPRHPDRHRDVASAPRQAYPQEEPRGRTVARRERRDRLVRQVRGDDAAVPRRHAVGRRGARGRGCISSAASWCAKRYRFEERLRHYVRVATAEPMSPELKAKLAAPRAQDLRSRTSTSPGGRRSLQSTSTGSSARAPSSGTGPRRCGRARRGGSARRRSSPRRPARRRGRAAASTARGSRSGPSASTIDGGVTSVAERGEAAAQRRAGAALPVGAVDERTATLVRGGSSGVRPFDHDDSSTRQPRQRVEHGRQELALLGPP